MIKTLTEIELTPTECASCGIVFALPEAFENRLQQNHNTFYCPNGHAILYRGKTEAEEYKEKLIATQEHCTHLETELNGTLKRLASVQKRIHAGICPCCNRHFANIERHMATKHPKQEAAGK